MIIIDEIEAACNLIKRSRLENKKNKVKTLHISLFKENNHVISTGSNVCIRYNDFSFSHYLSYKGKKIYPSINNKLKCINEAGLLKLKKVRNDCNHRYKEYKHINFYENLNINLHVGLAETIHYNENNGNVYYYNKFQSKEKLIYVDIE